MQIARAPRRRFQLTYANGVATLALVIAVASTPVAEAAKTTVARALFANDAAKVGGVAVSKQPAANKLLPLDARGKFPVSVVPAGAAGDDGVDGANGAPGATGPQGLRGPAGEQGSAGTPGVNGAPGLPGTVDYGLVYTKTQANTQFLGATGKAASATMADSATTASSAGYATAAGTASNANMLGNLASSAFLRAGVGSLGGGFDVPRSGSTAPASGNGEDCILGTMKLFAGNFAPNNYLFAHHQTMQINQNTALFSILGTGYGGDGRTTFQLPDGFGLGPNGTSYIICTYGIYPSRG